uniref:Uncharacterized protein n=1 Tax=Solanum tuberosum TaxID=4113 RepID=M1DB28_SOLTU
MAMESTTQVTGKQKKKGHQASLVQEANSEPNEAAESRIKEITSPRVMIQESIRQPDPSKQKEWDEIVQASRSSSKQSWADEVEAMQEVQRKPSIWKNFDINKVSDAGFQLEFVAPEIHRESAVCEIGIEDISSEIAY